MAEVHEIADGVFRIATYVAPFNLQFAQFLVRDEEPLLFHTGMRGLFPEVRDAVATVIDPSTLRWVGFSHFEADECGSLNEWQQAAPDATAVCTFVGKIVSGDDFAPKNPARGMADGETFETGTKRFRFLATPHVPHCWEAGMLFEETSKTLFCSDILHQNGDVPAMAEGDIIGAARQTFVEGEQGPLAGYFPYTRNTDPQI